MSPSFCYAYAQEAGETPLPNQYLVRRVIQRFSHTSSLVNVICTIKSPAQAKGLFAPDPSKPLQMVKEDQDAHIANWLLELAKSYRHSTASFLEDGNEVLTVDTQHSVTRQDSSFGSSRAFLVVAHAILALYQLLPFPPLNPNPCGVPMLPPAIDSLKTALHALHLLSKNITTAMPNSRTRTQALLLDAMPRVVAFLDLFTTTSLDSLDHFILVASHKDVIGELTRDLSVACIALQGDSGQAGSLGPAAYFEQASKALQAVAGSTQDVQAKPEGDYGVAGWHSGQGEELPTREAVSGTSSDSEPSLRTDSQSECTGLIPIRDAGFELPVYYSRDHQFPKNQLVVSYAGGHMGGNTSMTSGPPPPEEKKLEPLTNYAEPPLLSWSSGSSQISPPRPSFWEAGSHSTSYFDDDRSTYSQGIGNTMLPFDPISNQYYVDAETHSEALRHSESFPLVQRTTYFNTSHVYASLGYPVSGEDGMKGNGELGASTIPSSEAIRYGYQ